MSHYIQCSPNMVTVCVCSKLKTSWKLVVISNKAWKNSRYFVGVFVFPLTLAGRVMIIANSYPTRTRGIIVNYNDHGTQFSHFRTSGVLHLLWWQLWNIFITWVVCGWTYLTTGKFLQWKQIWVKYLELMNNILLLSVLWLE